MSESVWEREFHRATDAVFELENERDDLRSALNDALITGDLYAGERDELKAEVVLGKQRLGPAGWKMIQDIPKLKARVQTLEGLLKDSAKYLLMIKPDALGEKILARIKEVLNDT